MLALTMIAASYVGGRSMMFVLRLRLTPAAFSDSQRTGHFDSHGRDRVDRNVEEDRRHLET